MKVTFSHSEYPWSTYLFYYCANHEMISRLFFFALILSHFLAHSLQILLTRNGTYCCFNKIDELHGYPLYWIDLSRFITCTEGSKESMLHKFFPNVLVIIISQNAPLLRDVSMISKCLLWWTPSAVLWSAVETR
jgi:hypothetical protein